MTRTDVPCPRCGHDLDDDGWTLSCECGWSEDVLTVPRRRGAA